MLLFGFIENSKKFNCKSYHDNNGAKGNSQKAKSIITLIQCHYKKTKNQHPDTGEHENVICFTEGEFFFLIHNSSRVRLATSSGTF